MTRRKPPMRPIPCLLLVLLPLTATAIASAQSLNYTALGDSISAGIGATIPLFYGYVSYFRDSLVERGNRVSLSNRSIPGISSTELLFQLTNDPATRRAVANAQIVTISIGGNNLLRCADSGYTLLDTSCGARGVAAFQADWPLILAQIRSSIGSRATLYVMTLYNPYLPTDANYTLADTYVRQVNSLILNPAYLTTYAYKVADAYTDFQGMAPGSPATWKTCLWTRFCAAARDPHPTDEGHREIARLHASLDAGFLFPKQRPPPWLAGPARRHLFRIDRPEQ